MNKKLLLAATALYLGSMSNNEMPIREEKTPKEDLSYLRKKCKSCKLFPCSDSRHRYRANPLSVACAKYIHK